MALTVLEMTKELVMAQIKAGGLSLEGLQGSLQTTFHSLLALKTQERAGGREQAPGTVTQLPDWKASIRRSTITCLECGAVFKQLSIRHLKEHTLDSRSYRKKYNIPRAQPLSAKATTDLRKHLVQQSRPWEKAPTYLKAKGRKRKGPQTSQNT